MDSFGSEEEATAQLSLSLVSYGSDVDSVLNLSAVDAPDCSSASCPTDISAQNTCLPSSVPNEDELILKVAAELGLSGITNEKLDELSLAMEKMRTSQRKYVESKTIFDTVVKVSESESALPPATAQRLKQALQHISLLDYVTPLDTGNSDNCGGVFGITKNHLDQYLPIKLTDVDRECLRLAVSEEIKKKHQELVQFSKRRADMMTKLSGLATTESGNCAEPSITHSLVSLRSVLDREIAINKKYMGDLNSILQTLAKAKVDLHHLNTKKLEFFKTKCENLKMQIRSLNAEIQRATYLEDPHLVEAYTTLKNTLDLAIDEAKSELVILQKKDTEYEKLRGTHFDQLVREYNDLKRKIDEKEFAIKSLGNYKK